MPKCIETFPTYEDALKRCVEVGTEYGFPTIRIKEGQYVVTHYNGYSAYWNSHQVCGHVQCLPTADEQARRGQ